MTFTIEKVQSNLSEKVSELIHFSFSTLAGTDWEPAACQTFLLESLPPSIAAKIHSATYSIGAFSNGVLVGFLLMSRPEIMSMLFVHPSYVRKAVGRSLWISARAHITKNFTNTKTIELNSTPNALQFYRSIGFMRISSAFEIGGCRATRMACWLPTSTE